MSWPIPAGFIVEQSLVGISAVMLVVFYRRDLPGLLFENTTSSTKPEVRNVSQHFQGTERAQKLEKFSSAVFELCEWIKDRHSSSQHFAPLTGAK